MYNRTGGQGRIDGFIQNATLNGQPYSKNWITHQDLFANGGALELHLGEEEGETWGRSEDDVPPSYGPALSNSSMRIYTV